VEKWALAAPVALVLLAAALLLAQPVQKRAAGEAGVERLHAGEREGTGEERGRRAAEG
jgi:hypothetical protein